MLGLGLRLGELGLAKENYIEASNLIPQATVTQ